MADPSLLLKEATRHKKAGDLEKAILCLRKAYSAISRDSTIYPVETFLRLPMYLHEAGKKEEAWKEFNTLLTEGYPKQNLLQDKGLICFNKSHITDKIRLCFWRDGRYAEAVKYGIVSFLFAAAALKLQGRKEELADYLCPENVHKMLKRYLSKAGKEHLLDKIQTLTNSHIQILPVTNYNELCRYIDMVVLRGDKEV